MADLVTSNGDRVTLSPDLSSMVEQLELKGQQLYTLKKYAEDVRSGRCFLESISSLNTPEAQRSYETKVKSMRLLQELRNLKSI